MNTYKIENPTSAWEISSLHVMNLNDALGADIVCWIVFTAEPPDRFFLTSGVIFNQFYVFAGAENVGSHVKG